MVMALSLSHFDEWRVGVFVSNADKGAQCALWRKVLLGERPNERLSYPTETVLSNNITRNIIVLTFKDSPRKPFKTATSYIN